MKKSFCFFFSLYLIPYTLYLSSCCGKKKIITETETTTEQKRDFVIEGYTQATVINYELDGCKYILQLPDEKKLEPLNLPDEFKKDQLRVWIKYVPKKNAVSVCMAGQIVELTDIRIRK